MGGFGQAQRDLFAPFDSLAQSAFEPIDYNDGRPHSSVGGLTPTEYVEHTGRTLTAVGL